MANYRKSFNFRNGVQVDDDNFVINANGLVGIGTSIPREVLDVYGNNHVTGLTSTGTLSVSGTSNFNDDLNVGSNITLDESTGSITANTFFGDASTLSNIYAISTTGWVAGVGLHTFRSVGIGTTNPETFLQIEGNPNDSTGVAIGSGNIKASGIVTANSLTLVNSLSAGSNLSIIGVSTLSGNVDLNSDLSIGRDLNVVGVSTFQNNIHLGDNDAIKIGDSDDLQLYHDGSNSYISDTGTGELRVSGNEVKLNNADNTASLLVATAGGSVDLYHNGTTKLQTTATGATISGTLIANGLDGTLNSSSATITDATVTNATITNIVGTSVSVAHVNAGVSTFSTIRVDKTEQPKIDIIGNNASFSLGQVVGGGNSSAIFTFDSGTLRVNNFDLGGIEFNLHEGSGAGSTDTFRVKYDNEKQFEVTHDGKVGVNRDGAVLTHELEVGGDLFVDNDAKIVGVLTVSPGTPFEMTFGDGSSIPFPNGQNFNTITGISTLNFLTVRETIKAIGVSSYFHEGIEKHIGLQLEASDAFIEGSVGIGTTILGEQTSGLTVLGNINLTGKLISQERIALVDDGILIEDPRAGIPTGSQYSIAVPTLNFGNFQIKSGASSLIGDTFILVPDTGSQVAGYGFTNMGVVPTNTLVGGNGYLMQVGINTFFPRSIFDVGTGTPSMNSYFIPPSLTQSDINTVKNLWNSSGTGGAQARKITPNGIVPGGIVHNQTTNTIQVGHGTNNFRNLSPVVAFATINTGSLVSTDGYNFSLLSNSTNDADFTFSTALQSADYTVMVSFGSTTVSYTVPEAEKQTTGFRVSFDPSTVNASDQSYSVMILQI